jgi:lipopolysaccharide transport system permease protein
MVVPLIIIGRQFDFGQNVTAGVSYEAFAFVGLMFWQIFWDSVVFPQWMMRRTRHIIKTVELPPSAILIAGCFYVLFNLSTYMVLIVIVLLLFKAAVSWTILLTMLSIPVIMISGLSLGIFIAPITLVYLDIRYGLPMLSGLLLWSAPIAYAKPDKGLLHVINTYNPVTYLIDTPRHWMFSGLEGSNLLFIICSGFFMVLFFLSLRFYHRTVPVAVEQIL